jgi:hypothetical protein
LRNQKGKNMIDKIVNLLKNHFAENLIALVVFGSYARGDFRESSDIDLFVIIEGLPQRHFERTTLMSSLLTPNFSRRITAIAKTKREFLSSFPPLYLDLALDGQVAYDTGGFMKERLAEIEGIIEQAGLFREKKETQGHRWDWHVRPKKGWAIDWQGYREL